MIKYITRRDGQRLRADDPDADPLEAAEAAPEESLEDLESAEASAAEAARAEERATLRALSREVETSCGTQFALDLGA
ncbi:hypothetical protein GS896_25230 [Rhodococcus hoagii]|nr:hypothetical protein [Prescottella equi]MBM4654192.1 hypothetical protein [Prescottella equi]MBM4719666.1 hypothetical protein [Prescottella equi]NKR23463.1 hypothetical protein [Prescottella equi]NKT55925.1 hypothetical protein [Prescottella equi]